MSRFELFGTWKYLLSPPSHSSPSPSSSSFRSLSPSAEFSGWCSHCPVCSLMSHSDSPNRSWKCTENNEESLIQGRRRWLYWRQCTASDKQTGQTHTKNSMFHSWTLSPRSFHDLETWGFETVATQAQQGHYKGRSCTLRVTNRQGHHMQGTARSCKIDFHIKTV